MPILQDTPLTTEQQIILLPTLSTAGLIAKYAEIFGERPRTLKRPCLIRQVAWRLQMLAEGGFSEWIRQRTAGLASDAEVRQPVPRPFEGEPPRQPARRRPTARRRELPPAGRVLSRRYRGRMFEVKMLARGFEYDGRVYATLSAVARAITGAPCNGFRFFGLNTQSETGSP